MKVKVTVSVPMKRGKSVMEFADYDSIKAAEYIFEMSLTGAFLGVETVIGAVEAHVEKNFPPNTKIVSVEEIDRDNVLNG